MSQSELKPNLEYWLVVRVDAKLRYLNIFRPNLSYSAGVRVDMALNRLISLKYVFIVPVSGKNFSMLNTSSNMNFCAEFTLDHSRLINIVHCDGDFLRKFILRLV